MCGTAVQDQKSGKVIAKGPKCGRLFPLELSTQPRNKSEFAFSCLHSNNVQLWHNRLGHPDSKVLLSLFKSGLINEMKNYALDVILNCSTCKLGKSKNLPFPLHDSISEQCFELIHSDFWGITSVISHSHYKYFVRFIDDL